MPKKKMGPDEETIDDLIGPVCVIAELNPTTAWPEDLIKLIAAARNVRALYGFGVETIKL